MKKFTALIIIICVLFSGCASEQDKLLGRWETTLDITGYLRQELAENSGLMAEYLEPEDCAVILVWTFYQDGTYSVAPDQDALEEAQREFFRQAERGMTTYLEDEVSELGMEPSEYLASLGLTMDSFLVQLMGEDPIVKLTEDLERRGCYALEDGKMYLSGSLKQEPDQYYLFYELHEETLILEQGKTESGGFPAELLYPSVLRR